MKKDRRQKHRRQRQSASVVAISSNPKDAIIAATTRSTLCFQDLLNTFQRQNYTNLDDNDNDNDGVNMSNVFFELANAPLVSYRLIDEEHSNSSNSDDDGNNNNTNTNNNTDDNTTGSEITSSTRIVIYQDVSGAARIHTGGIVWETSYLLLNYLLSPSNDCFVVSSSDKNHRDPDSDPDPNDDDTDDRTSTTATVLEIGAGCGMLGLTLYKAIELGIVKENQQPRNWRVILTETDEVINNLRRNFEINYGSNSNVDNTADNLGANISSSTLIDANNNNNNNNNSYNTNYHNTASIMSSSSPPFSRRQLSINILDWTRYKQDCFDANIDQHSIDYIFGTDVVFSTRFVKPMLETMRFLSHENTVIYLCLQERCHDSHILLLNESTNYGFHLQDISEQVFDEVPLCNFGRTLECKLIRLTTIVASPAVETVSAVTTTTDLAINTSRKRKKKGKKRLSRKNPKTK